MQIPKRLFPNRPTLKPQSQLALIQTDLAMTDDEIIAQIKTMKELRETNPHPMVLATIDGFDDDARELHEIPEVVAFAKRLHEMGFTYWLDPTDEEQLLTMPGAPMCGLLWWLLGTGRVHQIGSISVNTEEFSVALEAARKASEALGVQP